MVDAALGIPASALARFTDAEARLYPMAMVDPDGYQRATVLVGLVADALRAQCADLAAVLDRRAELIDSVPSLAEGAGIALGNLPAEAVVDAAAALRCRELQAAATRAAAQARLDAARAAGQEWLIEEPDPTSVLAGSYRRVERHLPSGATIVASMEADAAATYRIELVPGDETGTAQSWTYPDRDAWTAAVAKLRADVAGRDVSRVDH